MYAYHRYFGIRDPAVLDLGTGAATGSFHQPGQRRAGHDEVPGAGLPDLLRGRPEGQDHVGLGRRAARRADPPAAREGGGCVRPGSSRGSASRSGSVAAGIWLVAGVAKVADLEHFHTQVGRLRRSPARARRAVRVRAAVRRGRPRPLPAGRALDPAGRDRRLRADGRLHRRAGAGVVPRARARLRLLRRDLAAEGRARARSSATRRSACPSLAMAIWPARLLSLDSYWLGRPDRFAIGDP